MSVSAHAPIHAVVRAILVSVSDQQIVLKLPGTDYQIHLVPTVPAARISTSVGKRIKGTIHGQAQRMFLATGGGRFIEPIAGEPRIVAGLVLAVDESNNRVLVDVAAPIWMSLLAPQPASMFHAGDLVNCYLKSGAQFTPE